MTDHQDSEHRGKKTHSAQEHHPRPQHSAKHYHEPAKKGGDVGRRRQKIAAERAKARRAAMIKLVFILACLFLFSLAGISFSSTNGFCVTCHEMEPDYVSWQESSHRDVNCVQCHIGPGFFNTLIHKIASIKSLYYHITNDYEKPINADGSHAKELKDENCLQCHEKTLSREAIEEAQDADIRPAHDKHRNLGLQCTSCHNRIAHQIKGYKDKSKMKACLFCHQGSSSEPNCSLCHSNLFLLRHNK